MIVQLYSARALDKAFDKLQKFRGQPNLSTTMESPEIVGNDVLLNWLAFNYQFATDFDESGDLLMGEIGGIIPTHPKTRQRILAVAEASISKVMYGFQKVSESRRVGDSSIMSGLEEEIETQLKDRKGVTVVDGNRNVAHYDFTTCVATSNPLEALTTNGYLLFRAEGITVLSNKCLPQGQYIFNIPKNKRLFERIRGTEVGTALRLDAINEMKDILIPPEFIAGFHIEYAKDGVSIRPLICERDATVSREAYQANPVASDIWYLGISGSHGEFGLMEKPLIR